MKRRLLFAAGGIALVVIAIGGLRLLRTLSFFEVRRVELVGGHYLTVADVTRALAIPAGYSVFDDKAPLERRAKRIPGVLEARITRRLPGTIRVIIREAEPVALSERSGRLVLVDGSGRVLPFDPTRPAADLPLGDPDSTVAGLLARVRATDAALFGRIERAVRFRQDVAVEVGTGRILFRAGASSEEIRDLSMVADLLARQGRVWRELDGRFLPRVILREERVSAQPQRLVAAVDLGTTKVVGLIGEVTGESRQPRVRILGAATERTAGVRRGVVRDIEETTRSVAKAMKDAQVMAGVEVGTVYCGVAGEHISARSSHGVVSVTGSEIRTTDVARVNDVASNISFGRDHELLHAIPQDYLIDQQEGITEPIGMTGSRLEAEVYLVTVLQSAVQNLRKCVEKAGYHVGEFVLEPLAASLAVLTPDERELGCAIVEMGGGSTNVSIFHSGKIRHTASSMFAGGHVTNDIVHGLQVTQQDAERLKERFGAAYEPLVPETDVFQLPGTPGQGPRTAHRRVLAHIMHMRLQEVLELALDEVSRAGYRQRLPAGIILTGGGAQAPGVVELAREVFALPVRVGTPGEGLTGLVDSVETPRMAVPVGLLLYGAKEVTASGGFAAGRRSPAVEKVLGPVKRWLQDFF